MPPGCTWACTFVKVYYLGDFDEHVVRHPQVDLEVYVDDFLQSATGTNEAVTTFLTEATEDISHIAEHQIRARLVPSKAAVVASNTTLARKLQAALGELAGEPVSVTEALGIDFAAARPRRAFAKNSRIRARI